MNNHKNTKGEKAEGNTNSVPSSRSKWTTINITHETKLELQRQVLEFQFRTPEDLIFALLNENKNKRGQEK